MRHAAMLEHPTLAVAAIQKGRIRETNAAWKALFALPPDVSVETHVAALFPNVNSADRFERGLQGDLSASHGGSPVGRSETMLVRRDGSTIPAEVVVWLDGAEDVHHPLAGDALWMVRDTTVERTLRRELRDLEDYHRELSRHQWDMTFVVDRKGRIAYASSSIEGALGYRVHAMLGRPFSSVLEPSHAVEAEKWLRAATRKPPDPAQSDDGFPLRVLHSDGSVRTLACRLRDCFGIPRITGMVVHARDVTDCGRESESPDRESAEAASLRAALLELSRSPSSETSDARIVSLLDSIRERLAATDATFWQAGSHDSGSAWVPLSSGREQASDHAMPPPPRVAANPALDGLVVVEDAGRSHPAGSDGAEALAGFAVGARIEVPVLDDGRTLGWITVDSAAARRWTSAEIDFVVGGALLVARAVQAGGAPIATPGTPVDPLTGLAGRAEAEQRLSSCVAAAAPGDSLVAIVVGLDRLQDINDAQGLAAGDAAIARTAALLVELARPDGFVARIGGDQFLIVVEGFDTRQVDELVNAIPATFAEAGGDATSAMPVGASIGIARLAFDGSDAATLLLQADLAMREAKSRGGGQSFVFNSRLGATLRMKRELDGEIEDALRRNEFTIFYQPQIALGNGGVVGMEALLRWVHPTRGMLLPDAFIGSAFNQGLVDTVTKLVLTQVCEQIAAWRRAGVLPELPVSVNVSGRQFHDRRLPALVASALLKSGLPARLLVLEITEQSLVGDEAGIDRVVKELSRLGVRIAIGGFNVGQTSFRYLRQLSVSHIKLDQDFVKGLPADPESAIFVGAFVDLAHRLKYQVIAEGVETREQFLQLREMGCGVAQGFYFGPPMSAAEVHSYVLANVKNPVH